MARWSIGVAVVLAGLACPVVFGQSEPASVLPGGAGTAGAPEGLGAYFESPLAKLTFRPPAGAHQINRAGDPDEIVSFVDDARHWTVKVSKLRFSQPVPLSSPRDSAQSGLLEIFTDKLKESKDAEVLRSDVTNVAGKEVPDTALLAVRYVRGTQNLLTQQAIVKATDLTYYILDFTSPGAKPGVGVENATPEEKAAVATFSSMVDSMRVLDRSDVRSEQNDRLDRTRTLFVNLTESRIRKALVAEQWLRIIHDGKDIGYTYVINEEAERAGRKGVLVGARSRSVSDLPGGEGEQADRESMFFVAFDRKFEEWTTVTQLTSKAGKKNIQELGASSREERLVVDKDAERGDPKSGDQNQPASHRVESYKLTVAYSGRGAGMPVQRQPPPWYLPQALGELLPRLVPLKEPKGYMFASYVSENHELMMRYVDVMAARDVKLAGAEYRAVPVSERIGIQGSPTVHYYTVEGKYLGSVAESAKIMILPADADAVQKIWGNRADLSRPKAPDTKIVPVP